MTFEAAPVGPTGLGAGTGGRPDDSSWADDLAARLFSTPARWGWQTLDRQEPSPPPGLDPGDRPVWVEPPRPDTSELRRERSAALWGVIRRLLVMFFVLALFATTADDVRAAIISQDDMDAEDFDTYQTLVLIVVGVLALRVLPRLGAFYVAIRNLREFERPYLAARAAGQEHYERVTADWDHAVAEYDRTVRQMRADHAQAPLWAPIYPATEPMRVDVVGGDPRRHGWASLMVTVGASVVGGGERMVVLDLTGRDVGGGLLDVAKARGLRTQRVDLPADFERLHLLGGVSGRNLADCLAYTLTGGSTTGDKQDQRHERALVADLVERIVGCFEGEVTFARLAAAVQVLRRSTPADVLSVSEVRRLTDQIGELGHDEWATRQLRYIASQFAILADLPDGGALGRPLWSGGDLSLVATAGGKDDRKELIDRLLVQLARTAAHNRRRFAEYLVVAGADHLGAATLDMLSDHARTTGVRLLLMIDQPYGDFEPTVGTGGVVCVMRMYNHRDAAVAAEFIGHEYRFVVSEVTVQTGRSFTDSGGGSFSSTTDRTSAGQPGTWQERGATTHLAASRGHTWTGVQDWAVSRNFGTTSTSTRVHEFRVHPQEIMAMPETAFILVDSSGPSRRVVMADSNPGISMLGRVAVNPA